VTDFDAVLIVSFGGPEGPDDVLPFLANVTRGRGIPPARLEQVAANYARLGGISPINVQCRRLQAALGSELAAHGHELPVYWGNRNWRPYLTDTIARMADDGIRSALAIVTSAYSSYSACRQYLDDIDAACAGVGDRAPSIEKIRPYFDHPGFVEPFRDALAEARRELDDPCPPIVFTAHSIPVAMAATCDYEEQLRATAALVAEASPASPWDLVWQSRSGPPDIPWLEPDVNDHLRALAAAGHDTALIAPIGFVSDHMEVVWDLDHEAASTAASLGLRISRATSPGTRPDPRFVTMWRELIEERLCGSRRVALSDLAPRPTPCRPTCCPPPSRTA